MSKILAVVRKELSGYFATPTALIFLGAYLFVSLFTFFWVEKFFSRNIADLRSLFEWMPILMIFLISTLTMKMWSEERRVGTVEFLLTLPVKISHLVLGKFFACMSLVGIALILTLGLAVTVGLLGHVDWGPVFGAYFASLLLAGAYVSIGLYVSSKTNSQIISLIVTTLVCLSVYLMGSDLIVAFFGNTSGELLKLLGSGSRFEAISRGVLDFRDIYYYLSVVAVFLTLNTASLTKLKWSTGKTNPSHSKLNSIVALTVTNLLLANVWLNHVHSLRKDITENKIYSISQATKDVITQLQEPLLIRGYFSERTHSLLAPLVPVVKDLLREYELVANGKVSVEIVDPRESEELEAEANRQYGIEPVPFQMADRHSTSIVNSYFNIVVQYGDQHRVLGFNDLIEVKQQGIGDIDVKLRNLEYDITSSMKKVLHSFNNTDNLFASLKKPIKFVGYISDATLPEALKKLTSKIKDSLDKFKANSQGKLEVEFLDPMTNQTVEKKIVEDYGFKPQTMSLFSQERFYFYLTIQDGDKIYRLGIPDELKIDGFNKSMEAALKRVSPGFLRTVGLVTPKQPAYNPMMAQYGMQQGGKQFRAVQQKLEENYRTITLDLETGTINPEVDILLVVAPKDLNEKQVFALDQYLMRGATVILSTSPLSVKKSRDGFSAEDYESGLDDWLAHHGVKVEKEFVLDTKNTGFPSIRKRVVQGVTIKEPFLAPYPLFVDIRQSGLSKENGIVSGLNQISFPWGSPIIVDNDKNKSRKVTTLLRSSKESWRTQDTDIEPNLNRHPEWGFEVASHQGENTLGVLIQGRFESYYKGKKAPIIESTPELEPSKETKAQDSKEEKKTGIVATIVEKSPEIARLIVYSSNELIADDTIQISGMVGGTQYLKSLQLFENTVDWSMEDGGLLSIRSRGHFARTLDFLKESDKNFWELLNYGFAILGLIALFFLCRYIQAQSLRRYKVTLDV